MSDVLFCSFGLIHGESWPEFSENNFLQTAFRKSAPASGGLHAEEVYLINFRVKGLAPGLYHYYCKDHALGLVEAGDFERGVIEMNFDQYYSAGMAFGIYLTARFDKLWWKYKHSRSYRVALLDIGHVSHNFLLSCASHDLETWLTAAFYDEQVNQFLRCDQHEHVIHFVGAGVATGKSFPNEMVNVGYAAKVDS